MKKVILTVAAMLAISFANAQDKSGGDIKFGIKAGYVSANYGADANDGDARSSFYAGGLVDFTVSEKFHVQPELLYSMEGNDEEEADLSFVRIPIMAKYYVKDGLSLQAGPSIAFVADGGSVTGNERTHRVLLSIALGGRRYAWCR